MARQKDELRDSSNLQVIAALATWTRETTSDFRFVAKRFRRDSGGGV